MSNLYPDDDGVVDYSYPWAASKRRSVTSAVDQLEKLAEDRQKKIAALEAEIETLRSENQSLMQRVFDLQDTLDWVNEPDDE